MVYYQHILIVLMFVMILKVILNRQHEKKLIRQVNHIFIPISHDVLLDTRTAALKNSQSMHNKNAERNITQPHTAENLKAQINQINTNMNETKRPIVKQQTATTKMTNNKNNWQASHQTLDTEFENLLEMLEKRAQLRKKL